MLSDQRQKAIFLALLWQPDNQEYVAMHHNELMQVFACVDQEFEQRRKGRGGYGLRNLVCRLNYGKR